MSSPQRAPDVHERNELLLHLQALQLEQLIQAISALHLAVVSDDDGQEAAGARVRTRMRRASAMTSEMLGALADARKANGAGGDSRPEELLAALAASDGSSWPA